MINNALDGLKLSQTIKNIKIMGRELSDVFKAKTRVGQRKILDKFDISKEDKNKFLNGIEDAGSGGNGSDEDSNIEYLDITNVSSYKELLLQYSFRACVISDDVKMNATSFAVYNTIIDLISYKSLYIQTDFKSKVYGIQSGQTFNLTIMEVLNMANITQEQLDAIPRITKEQFYSLE